MTMTDPIADMLTRIRNGLQAHHSDVLIPLSTLKRSIAGILKEEGYINNFTITKDKFPGAIKIQLRYGAGSTPAITELIKISKPGCKVYVGLDEIPSVKNGLGTAILSTSKGVITGKKARLLGIGGELICSIY